MGKVESSSEITKHLLNPVTRSLIISILLVEVWLLRPLKSIAEYGIRSYSKGMFAVQRRVGGGGGGLKKKKKKKRGRGLSLSAHLLM